MKVVLVTGASGFVGHQVVRALTARGGVEVHGVARRGAVLAGAVPHRVDVLDAGARNALLSSVPADTLIHCAWTVEHGRFWTEPANRDWVSATTALIQRFVELGGRRVVGIGSMAEYDWTTPQPLSETATPLNPSTLYGQSKLSLFQRFSEPAGTAPSTIAWVRLFNMFGEREDPRRLVPYVIRSLLAGETAKCTHGRQIRDYLDVREVGRAIAAVAASSVTGAVNVASGQPVRQGDVVDCIGRIVGRPDLIALGAVPAAVGEPTALEADVTRLTREVGYTPDADLERDLLAAVLYWRRAA